MIIEERENSLVKHSNSFWNTVKKFNQNLQKEKKCLKSIIRTFVKCIPKILVKLIFETDFSGMKTIF